MGGLFGGFDVLGGLFQPQFDLPGVVPLFKRAFPVNFGHELFAQLVEDIAVVNHQFGAFLSVERHGLLQDLFGFIRVSQLEEHPRMGVQIGRVVVGERHHAA